MKHPRPIHEWRSRTATLTFTNSANPIGGTAVSLAVGVGVGLAMSIDTGDGKNLGDRIADVGEGFWNFGKRVFGG